MRKRLLVVVAAAVCLALLLVGCRQPATPSFDRGEAEAILDTRLPTTAAELEARLGKWDSVDLPTKDELVTTPEGQWFRWSLNGMTFTALNQEYGSRVSTTAPIVYVQLNSDEKDARDATAFNLTFNRSTRSDLRTLLGSSLEPCTGSYFGDGALKMREGDNWWFFWFAGDKLVGIAYGLDLDTAG